MRRLLAPRSRAVAFLEAARHLASRRFLKDGARSLLPQYRQSSFFGLLADWYRRGLAALVAMVGATFASRAGGWSYEISFSGGNFGIVPSRTHIALSRQFCKGGMRLQRR